LPPKPPVRTQLDGQRRLPASHSRPSSSPVQTHVRGTTSDRNAQPAPRPAAEATQAQGSTAGVQPAQGFPSQVPASSPAAPGSAAGGNRGSAGSNGGTGDGGGVAGATAAPSRTGETGVENAENATRAPQLLA